MNETKASSYEERQSLENLQNTCAKLRNLWLMDMNCRIERFLKFILN